MRVSFHEGGRCTLAEVDTNDEATLAGEVHLSEDEVAYLDEVLQPDHLLTLGRSVGTGKAWARVQFRHAGALQDMFILHRTPEAVFDASAIVGLAKAAHPILQVMLFHLNKFALPRPGEFGDDVTELRGRPIAADGHHGRLLMRFTITEPTRSDRIWLKVYEGGVAERRLKASDETDGDPMNETPMQLGTGRVAELFELVKRNVPKGSPGAEPCVIWELYGTSGKRDVRVVSLDRGEPTRTGAPARVAAVQEAFLAFEAMLSRR